MNNPVGSVASQSDKMQTILEEGLKLFIRDGQQMSMRELARRMGVAVGGLYRYVQDRRDLWFMCQDHAFAQIASRFQKIAEKYGQDIEATLREIGNYLFDLAEYEYTRFRFLFLMEPPESSKPEGVNEAKCQRLALTDLFELLKAGVDFGQLNIPKDKIQDYGYVLWSSIMGSAILTSPMYTHFFVDEKPGWKGRIRQLAIDQALANISI